jgi:ubiquinone/menaquinone biosynthesis C-methylase UbiE
MGEIKYIPFEEESLDIKDRVEEYWTERAESFFAQKQHELESDKAQKWLGEILSKIKESFPGKTPAEIKVLDVGCGAGFFTVLLAKEGLDVTGIDLTAEMIEKAGKLIELNGLDPEKAKVLVMDAEKLSFADETFDIVISRNLTWTLPHPIEAYQEWARVLKKGGILLNFDAEYAKGDHNLNNQDNLAHKDVSKKLKAECHEIYHMLTISALDRPQWDEKILRTVGFSDVETDTEFYSRIFDKKDEFYIPDKMFMIAANR